MKPARRCTRDLERVAGAVTGGYDIHRLADVLEERREEPDVQR